MRQPRSPSQRASEGRATPAGALPLVVVALPMHYGYYRDIVLGISRYAGRKWRLVISLGVGPDQLDSLVAGGLKGMILTVFDTEMVPALAARRVPALNVSGRARNPGVTTVRTDDEAIGRLAANHLLDRGQCLLATWEGGGDFYQRRADAFARAVEQARAEVIRLPSTSFTDVETVRGLPAPMGVFLPTDQTAAAFLSTCHQAGRRVPDDLAVVGVDNDPVYALGSTPTLTSVDPAADVIGFTAASKLDRLMARRARRSAPDRIIEIPPRGVEARTSSDLIYAPDSLVAQAVRHIREHACEGLSVEMVADAFTTSRRTLERRFRKQFGTSMLEAIRKVQMDHARDLLNHTDLTVAQVAERCGFSEARNFITRFRRDEGIPPGAFRKQRRMG